MLLSTLTRWKVWKTYGSYWNFRANQLKPFVIQKKNSPKDNKWLSISAYRKIKAAEKIRDNTPPPEKNIYRTADAKTLAKYETYNFNDIFEFTKKYISGADFSVGVFEGSLGGEEKNLDFIGSCKSAEEKLNSQVKLVEKDGIKMARIARSWSNWWATTCLTLNGWRPPNLHAVLSGQLRKCLSQARRRRDFEKNPAAKFIFIAPWTSTDEDKISALKYADKMKLNYRHCATPENFCKATGDTFINPNAYIKSVLNRRLHKDYLNDWIHPNTTQGVALYSEAVLKN